jgi:hypothetical protein
VVKAVSHSSRPKHRDQEIDNPASFPPLVTGGQLGWSGRYQIQGSPKRCHAGALFEHALTDGVAIIPLLFDIAVAD